MKWNIDFLVPYVSDASGIEYFEEGPRHCHGRASIHDPGIYSRLAASESSL